jgi:hypothetical protein
LEDTKIWVDEAIADQALVDEAIARYDKAIGQGNQYDKADIVELEVQYEVCHEVAKDVYKWQQVEFACAIALGCYGVLRTKFSFHVVVEDHGLYGL